MNIVIWDIETDSSNTFFGTIIEIGAILLNENFQELDKLNIRCRLPEGVVPQAGALLVNQSNVSKEEKEFLIEASKRHIVFNYQLIADYYSHSSKEMQKLMEDSALVIIDFEKAIELGYVQLSKEIRTQYLEEYGE